MPHGITIYGRIIEWWKVDRCDDIVSDYTFARAMQRHTFSFSNRQNPFIDQPFHVIEPQ